MAEHLAETREFMRLQNALATLARSSRRVWLAALGIAPAVGEGAGKVFEALVEKGERFESEQKEVFGPVGEKLSAGMDAAKTRLKTGFEGVGKSLRGLKGKGEGVLDGKVAAALERAGVPTRQEIGELAKRLDEISARLEAIAPRRSPPGGKDGKKKTSRKSARTTGGG